MRRSAPVLPSLSEVSVHVNERGVNYINYINPWRIERMSRSHHIPHFLAILHLTRVRCIGCSPTNHVVARSCSLRPSPILAPNCNFHVVYIFFKARPCLKCLQSFLGAPSSYSGLMIRKCTRRYSRNVSRSDQVRMTTLPSLHRRHKRS